jgi:ABC-type multidrug transport system permease subunit
LAAIQFADIFIRLWFIMLRGIPAAMNKKIFKSIGAVVAGVVFCVVLSIGTDFTLSAAGIFPPIKTGVFLSWMLAVALVYRCIYSVAGGYLTALLAPNRPMLHVIILGILGIIASVAGVVAGWNLPHRWYPIALVVTAFPCAWVGGKLRSKG